MRSHDLEGIVAKRLDDPYEEGWLKIKNPIIPRRRGEGTYSTGQSRGNEIGDDGKNLLAVTSKQATTVLAK
jgi:ATP-dependent DNA ligase